MTNEVIMMLMMGKQQNLVKDSWLLNLDLKDTDLAKL